MKIILNNLKNIYVLFLTIALFSSCSVLEEEIISGVTSEFYDSPEGYIKALDACYTPLRTYATEVGTTLRVFGTDEYTNGGHGNYHYMNQYTSALNSEAEPMWYVWSNFYQAINTCNTVVDRGPDIDLSIDLVNVMVAEARYLRAFYFFDLVRIFGPITIPLNESVGVITEASRVSESEVYQVIIEDLEFAIDHLPIVQEEFGRATKPAAESLLALVYLTRGYKDFGNDADFDKTAELTSTVINNYNFRLLDTPIDVFDQYNEDNEEVIWSIQFTSDLISNGEGNGTHNYFGAWFSFYQGLVDQNAVGYGRPWIRFRPTPWGLENFRPLDIDSRYRITFQDTWYYNDAEGVPLGSNLGDTAIWVTDKYLSKSDYDEVLKRMPNLVLYSWNLDNIDDEWYRPINMFPWPERKFGDYRRASDWATEGTRNVIIFRLADMIMLRAEANFKMGKIENAVEDINVIRRRAAFPGSESLMEVTADQIDIDFILDERAREFYGESKRWFDLTRTGKLIERVKLYNPEASNNIKDYHVLRPIPANQLTRVSNEYGQNPGY